MIFASKSTLSLKNLKILWPKDTKNLKNLPEKFCESPSRGRIFSHAGYELVPYYVRGVREYN